ncbi:arachidonate 12-12s-type [Stylonychia lemnae]|uniref:Arachidonate 12-12s-type n=1 Tax=Stylonychia lemnae TaxID=5949 RepID=A0A078ACE9_STYLE|nr:arachidonate 12-12s-type [Stylonychia lemnae]|eukprot:CDW79272.1 arachidonate 12-12s-type [Stylonychia lemnae]
MSQMESLPHADYDLLAKCPFTGSRWEANNSSNKLNELSIKVAANRSHHRWHRFPFRFFFQDMQTVFDNFSDEMPLEKFGNRRPKVTHCVGACSKGRWVSYDNHNYTGIFQGSEEGLFRFSLAKQINLWAYKDESPFGPGLAIKFPRSNIPSANMVFMGTSVGRPSSNFFEYDLSTHLPAINENDKSLNPVKRAIPKAFRKASSWPNMLGSSDFASFDKDGIEAKPPMFPYRIHLQPNHDLLPLFARRKEEVSLEDNYYLKQFASLQKNTIVYYILAQPTPFSESLIGPIGHLEITEIPVTSLYGDTKLFFRHTRMEDDFALHPEWKLAASEIQQYQASLSFPYHYPNISSLPLQLPNHKEKMNDLDHQISAQFEWLPKQHPLLKQPSNVPPTLNEIPPIEITLETEHRKASITKVANYVKKQVWKNNKMLPFQLSKDPFYPWLFAIRGMQVPSVVGEWRTDKSFAMQRLSGLNPGFIRKVHELPPRIAALLPSDVSIDSVYVCDYEILQHCKSPPERFLVLQPLAIQLDRISESPHIFTPHDPPGIWLCAKIHFQTADACFHVFCSHYAETHAIMEAVYVSMRRNLSTQHPLLNLLKPHFWYTIHIGDNSRRKLLGEEGILPKFMAPGFLGQNTLLEACLERWSFKNLDFPSVLADRGISNIPDYYWCDDSMELWNIIGRFINSIISLIYQSDSEVAMDIELAAWMNEITKMIGKGFRDIKGLNSNGTLQTREDLAFFLHQIIFNVTKLYSEYATFKLDPRRMLAQDDISEKEIAAALPATSYEGLMQIAIVSSLSIPTQRPIGKYEADFLFGIQGSHKEIIKFRQDLRELSQRIKVRNKHLNLMGKPSYSYLDPDRISQSIEL